MSDMRVAPSNTCEGLLSPYSCTTARVQTILQPSLCSKGCQTLLAPVWAPRPCATVRRVKLPCFINHSSLANLILACR